MRRGPSSLAPIMLRKVAIPLSVVLLLGAAVPAAARAPRPGRWTGATSEDGKRLTFEVRGRRVTTFYVRSAGASCVTGPQAMIVYVPRAAIRGRRIVRTYRVPGARERYRLRGAFTGPGRAHGTVVARGECDVSLRWQARAR